MDNKGELDKFLDGLYPSHFHEGYIEVRAIHRGDNKKLWRNWYECSAELVQDYNKLKKLNDKGYHMFFGVNPRYQKGGTKDDIKHIFTLHTDLDAKDFDDNIDHGKKLIWEKIKKIDPQPSLLVMSGSGYHCYWILKEPFEIESLQDIERIETINRKLGYVLGGDSVADISRILRLPGFNNVKDPKNSIFVKWKVLSDKVFNLKDFDHLPDPEQGVSINTTRSGNGNPLESIQGRWRQIISSGDLAGYPSRSERDMGTICYLASKGFTDAQIKHIFINYNIGEKYKESGDRYLNHQIGNAREWIMTSHQSSESSQSSKGSLPAKREFAKFSTHLNYDILTPSLLQFLEVTGPTTDSPDEFLISAFLGHWAGVVGNKLLGPHSIRPNVWIVNFAGSSEMRKSTANSTAGKPFQEVQKRFNKGLKEDWTKYKSNLLLWEGLPKRERAKLPEPEKPIRWNLLLSSDFSDAGFYEMMKENPASGVIVTNEFADFHRKLNRDYTGQADAFLCAYDNDRMVRVTRDNKIEIIEEPTFSIMGCTTFSNFLRVFTSKETENGFLQRILPLAIVNQTKPRMLLLNRKEIDLEYVEQIARQIKTWLDVSRNIPVVLSNDFVTNFNEWEIRFVTESKESYGEKITTYVERMIPACLKMSMLIESLEIPDPSMLDHLVISSDSFKCARMFIEDIFLPSMNYLMEEEIIFSKQRHDEKLVEKTLKNAGGVLDRTGLLRESRLTSKRIDESLSSLIEKSFVKVIKEYKEREQGGGNPKTFYTWIGD